MTPWVQMIMLACFLGVSSAFHIAAQPVAGTHRMLPISHRAPAPEAMLLVAEAPVMAEGAGMAAVAGGLVMILTAGIPILFLSGKDKPDDSATRAAGLEQGLKAEMGEDAFNAAMMEEVGEEVVADEPTAEDDDAEPKQRASI